MKSKKGMSTFYLFLFIFVVFFLAVFLGLALWGFSVINDILDQDIEIGQVNLREINNQTFGAINQGFVNNADLVGILLILGMCLVMIFNGYYVGSKYPKLFLVVDLLILVFVFITSVYIQQVYSIFINSADMLSAVYIDGLPKTSTFILKLPYFIGTLGALIMIVSYSGIKKREGEPRVYGY